ncbi:MAG: hypothetical protein KGI00_01145 [Candidatus Micrarchaeota archaeon]|nr:hypothetical protein [Candidatus Micrarchaeota archaeon]MDE1849314.1 hypothetical protein [Candidatus Micrarchaeota archaeon]
MAENKDNANIDPKELYVQLQYLQNLYSQQYDYIEENLASYTIANNSVRRSIELLSGADSVKNSKVLMSPDAGIYMEASIGELRSIITYVGAGYLVEKSVEDAKAFMEQNQRKGEEVLMKLVSDKQKLEKELLDINYRMGVLQQQLSGQ